MSADPVCRHWWRRRSRVRITARVTTRRVFCRRCARSTWPFIVSHR